MVFKEITKNWPKVIKREYETIIRWGLIVAACIALLLIAFFGYRLYVSVREQRAQRTFSSIINEYQQAMREKSPRLWSDVASSFEIGYQQQKSSALAPYFKAFQADALSQEGKRKEALQVMSDFMKELSDRSLLYNLFKAKYALMLLDSDDASNKDQAIAELEKLAQDSKNIYQDFAQYSLGNYYWTQGHYEKAKNIWQQLIDNQWQEKLAPSPWAQVAHVALQQIS